MGSEPSIRVGYMRMLVRQAERQPGAEGERLRLAFAEVHQRVHEAPILGWMPGAVNFDAVDQLVANLGREGSRGFFRGLYSEVWRNAPFLSSFMQGIVRMHRDPSNYFKHLPRGYGQIFRNFGEWRVGEAEPNRAQATLSRIPAGCFADDGIWLHCCAASLETVFELGGVQGESMVRDLDPAAGRAQFVFSWKKADHGNER